MIITRLVFIHILLAAGLWLSGCAAPLLDGGFVIRSDLRTTDCMGQPQADINSNQDFLTQKIPGEIVEVNDCGGRKVLRAAGLALRPGDVLFISTGAVAPRFADHGKPYEVMFPSAVAAPIGLALRKVDLLHGRLYQQEDQFLAGAFAMAARSKDQILPDTAPLVAALGHQQPVLWNTLIANLRLWRPVDNDRMKSDRPGLVLLVDYGKWCNELRSLLGAAPGSQRDIDALTAYFSGTAGKCPGDYNEAERPKLSKEYSLITNTAHSAVQAVALGPTAAGDFPSAVTDVALHTNLTVQVKGARMSIAETYSGNAHWTLADWENSGICVDTDGAPLSIKSLQMHDGTWMDLESGAKKAPTITVQLVFAQSLQARRFVAEGPWYKRWKHVLPLADLDKLYPADIRSVTWTSPPADPAMCLR